MLHCSKNSQYPIADVQSLCIACWLFLTAYFATACAVQPYVMTPMAPPTATASPYARVDADLAEFDQAVADMKAKFAEEPGDLQNKEWVVNKLAHMVEVDQYARKWRKETRVWERYQTYSSAEKEYFDQEMRTRLQSIDEANTRDLKMLLEIHGWFTKSVFGAEADQNAWLLAQHADHDVAFQKQVLALLESLVPKGETDPKHYAYLYDRVAVSEKRPQRYGTQGRCTGPGTWEPRPLEDPENVDNLRASVGLQPLDEYKKMFVKLCR